MLETVHGWSDCTGDVLKHFGFDALITNIMIYWVTQTINTSIRHYAMESQASYGEYGPKPVERVQAPTGVASFPGDSPLPREWADRMANVKRFTKLSKGGHFAPMEVPELWVDELRTFFFETAY